MAKEESQANVEEWIKKWHTTIHKPAIGQSNKWKREYYKTHANLLAARNPNSLKSSAPVQKHSEPAAAPASKATPKPLTREQAIEIVLHPGAFFSKMKANSVCAKKAHPVKHGGRRTRRRHTKHRHTRKN
jgi:hypothetical protein